MVLPQNTKSLPYALEHPPPLLTGPAGAAPCHVRNRHASGTRQQPDVSLVPYPQITRQIAAHARSVAQTLLYALSDRRHRLTSLATARALVWKLSFLWSAVTRLEKLHSVVSMLSLPPLEMPR
jgi:hypothetical protein